MVTYLRYTPRAAPGVAVIDIDRPEAHNALDRAGQRHFAELLAAAEADLDVRCLAVAGTRSVSLRSPSSPFGVQAGADRSTAARLARSRPGSDGYRGRLMPSLTVITAGSGSS